MDSLLRDMQRESEKMQDDTRNLQGHYDKLAGYVQQYTRQTTIEWARLVADHPYAILLVVETTLIVDERGIACTGENEPIRFTTFSPSNGGIWDQRVRPTHSHNVTGQEYHGLTLATVENQPTIDEAWEDIAGALYGRHVIIFGLDWAYRALQTVRRHHVLDRATCLHNRCKEYYNQFYQLGLQQILDYQGIDTKREELRDSCDRARMLAQVVRNLANGMPKQGQDEQEEELNGLEDLSEHPF